MAVEALIRKRLAGSRPAAGARSAIDALDLSDYDRLFAGRSIYTGVRRDSGAERSLPLYKRLLGPAWTQLPEPVRTLHGDTLPERVEGRADVERGRHLLARVIAWIVGLPPSGRDVPVSVYFERNAKGETWHRRFGKHSFKSYHSARDGRWRHLLVERCGPMTFGLALVVDEEGLHFYVRRWSVLGIVLPLRWAPVSRAIEGEAAGCFRFDIDLGHPLIGRIVRYRGWLQPATAPEPTG